MTSSPTNTTALDRGDWWPAQGQRSPSLRTAAGTRRLGLLSPGPTTGSGDRPTSSTRSTRSSWRSTVPQWPRSRPATLATRPRSSPRSVPRRRPTASPPRWRWPSATARPRRHSPGPSRPGGAFFQPTILTDVNPGSPAFQTEFFGPVSMVFRVGYSVRRSEGVRLRQRTHRAAAPRPAARMNWRSPMPPVKRVASSGQRPGAGHGDRGPARGSPPSAACGPEEAAGGLAMGAVPRMTSPASSVSR
jgi:hypothetical protein